MIINRYAATVVLSCLIAPEGCMTAPEIVPPRENCGATDPRIGQTAELVQRFHGVRGTARIVDDCTIVIENFTYDGGGLDVRVYGGTAPDFPDGVILSQPIGQRRYNGETLTVPLPGDRTLDDVPSIAIWCITVAENFGYGTFE